MPDKLTNVLLRGFAVWLVIVFAESLNGTAREIFLKPLVGDIRARQISFVTAMLIILAITFFFICWLGAANASHLLAVGFLWSALTFCFEILIARLVMNMSWERFYADYNPFKGGLMGIGLLFLVFAPSIGAKCQGYVFKKPDSEIDKTANYYESG